MTNKTKLSLLVLLILIVVGFLWYRGWKDKQKNSSGAAKSADSLMQNSDGSVNSVSDSDLAAQDQIDQDFNTKCENGEWVKIADIQGDAASVSGKLRRVYPDDELPQELKNFQYYIEGSENTALSGSDLSALDYFEDRSVEVQGVKSADGKSVAISQVKCAGAETDKTAIDTREKLMNWLMGNIGSVAPQKAPYQKWTIDTVEFVDENNLYVDYYDTIEDDENSDVDTDTSRRVLLEAKAKPDGSYDTTVLAYWEMGEDDYVLKTGADKFADVTDVYSYQYDPEEKTWTRI